MKKPVLIIAEAGVNHNGEIALAKKLIDAAATAGADYVKFQTFNSKKLVSAKAQMADYQKENTLGSQQTQLQMLQKLELTKNDHLELIKYCKNKNIKFLSTGFDLDSLEFLNDLNLDIFKIPSGEITNLPYLRKIGSFGKPVIISTGMADMKEIEDAYNVIVKAGISPQNITILHCNTEYPTPMEDVNLNAMITIGNTFGVDVGYSDHTLGSEVPIAAVALGASIIEKHFTLSKTMKGPDHKASMEPHELKEMIFSIRNIELALGEWEKKPSPSEQKNKPLVRKSIVANTIIRKGETFSELNITVKRPGHGISPMKWDDMIGKKAEKDYLEDDII